MTECKRPTNPRWRETGVTPGGVVFTDGTMVVVSTSNDEHGFWHLTMSTNRKPPPDADCARALRDFGMVGAKSSELTKQSKDVHFFMKHLQQASLL